MLYLKNQYLKTLEEKLNWNKILEAIQKHKILPNSVGNMVILDEITIIYIHSNYTIDSNPLIIQTQKLYPLEDIKKLFRNKNINLYPDSKIDKFVKLMITEKNYRIK